MFNNPKGSTMNLADPELELIDPTPNIHAMFLHFDKLFFYGILSSRSIVRWSKRMYSCAGICSLHPGGLIDIALSEPLLKLRPRKDLIETLLHEMIHGYLFITGKDNSRDGHGPYFQGHMHRINRAAGINISIYHNFHDEVKLYQTHWWQCNGPCRNSRPYFGIVRRTCNRPPGPSDYWWDRHKRFCGGTFIKIKEPKKPETKSQNAKPNADITKYLNNNDKITINNNKNIMQNNKPKKPITKHIINVPKSYVGIKNSGTNLIVIKKNVIFNPQVTKPNSIFSGTGQTISGKHKKPDSGKGFDSKRNIGTKKAIQTNNNDVISKSKNSNTSLNAGKHKADNHSDSPPLKMKKIDSYMKTIATSTLKDIYGQDFNVTQAIKDKKQIAITKEIDFVKCPICETKIDYSKINTHLDDCLSKDVIADCLADNIPSKDDSNKNLNNLSNIKNYNVDRKVPETILNKNNSRQNTKKIEKHVTDHTKSSSFLVTNDVNAMNDSKFKMDSLPSVSKDTPIKIEPGCSDIEIAVEKECLCCGNKLSTSVDEHLYECKSFFDNDNTTKQGASKPFSAHLTQEIIVINDDDDEFDETASLNATGTKLPCPCCLRMVEEIDMNNHLDKCLN